MIDHKQNGKRNNDMDRTNGDEDSFNRSNIDDDNNPTYRQGSYQGAQDSSSASRRSLQLKQQQKRNMIDDMQNRKQTQ